MNVFITVIVPKINKLIVFYKFLGKLGQNKFSTNFGKLKSDYGLVHFCVIDK